MHNVIFITLDAVRPDYLRFYNEQARAQIPFIEKLAARGAVFTQAITSFGGTPIAHASILTGTSPIIHGCSMIGHGYIQPMDVTKTKSISEILKNKGYDTAAFTSVHLLSEDLGYARGFDNFECNDTSTNKKEIRNIGEQITDKAIDWIKNRKGNWFLWLHYFDAHYPFFPPEPYHTEYRHDPYSGEIAYLDSQLARLFEAIDQDNTVTVITSDHGTSHGEHGIHFHGNFFENNLLVPLLITIPGCSPCLIDQIVRTIDIVPTVLDGLNIEDKPEELEGVSLLPLIADPNQDLNLTAYVGTAFEDGTIYAAIRTERYKLIIDNYSETACRSPIPGSKLEQLFGKIGIRLANLLRCIRYWRRIPLPYKTGCQTKKYLFDLHNDPLERLNLLGDLEPYVTGIGRRTPIRHVYPGFPWETYDAVAAELEEKLRSYLAEGVPRLDLSSEEKDIIIKRLRALGYVE